MRNSKKLSPLKVSKEKTPGRYADGGGLYLQVTPWGKDGQSWLTKSWLFRYMRDGHARQMGLGSVDTFSLREARERARAQRQLLADGIDPLEARERAKQAAQLEAARAIAFQDAAQRYIKTHAAGWRNEKHGEQWSNTLGTYAYPIIGNLPVAAIDIALIMKVLTQPVSVGGTKTEPFWNAKTETASRVRGRIESILDWAHVQRMRQGENPARWRANLDKLLPAKAKVAKVQHQPAMPYAQVPSFMAELRRREGISARALEFTILSAVRTNETISATWTEIDFAAKLWIIPPERMKSNREHRVPLTARALKILNGLPREHGNKHVFPGISPGQPLSNMAMLEVLRGMRPGYVVHGFRSSFRDWTGEKTSFPREVAEAALAHVLKDKTEAAYQRGDLLEKRRRLMGAWETYCTKPGTRGETLPRSRGG